MPASLELQERFGSDLQVILVESQRTSHEEMKSFALGRKWLGGRAMWTKERPVDVEGSRLPKFALLSNDGEVLLSGNPLELHEEIEDAVRAEIRRASSVPDELPRPLKRAKKEDVRGRRGKALAITTRLVESEDAAVAEAAARLFAELEDRTERELARARRVLESGRPLAAEELVDDLLTSLAGSPEHRARAEALREELYAPEMRPEKKAAKALARIESRLFRDGPSERTVRDLERFAAREAGTHAARIARELLEIVAR